MGKMNVVNCLTNKKRDIQSVFESAPSTEKQKQEAWNSTITIIYLYIYIYKTKDKNKMRGGKEKVSYYGII